MIELLRIRNLALIEEMQIEFAEGMNVITGETGAGKSFILNAINFLLGDKLSSTMVRPGADKASVEGVFRFCNDEFILRRELIHSHNRSRMYINNNLTTLSEVHDLGQKLITNTGQHSQLKFLNHNYRAKIIESLFPEPELITNRDALLQKLKELAAKRNMLSTKQKNLSEKRELFEMQQQEILKIAPEINEDTKLEDIRTKILSKQHTKKLYDNALAIIYGEDNIGLLALTEKFLHLMQKIVKENDEFLFATKNIANFYENISQIALTLKRQPVDHGDDIEALEARLFVLAQLKRKFKRTLPEIVNLLKDIQMNLSFLDECNLDFSRIKREENDLVAELRLLQEDILPLRRHSVEVFVEKIEKELLDLAFPKEAKVIPSFQQYEIWPGVQDEHVCFLWAPNPGQIPMPLEKIASGGELSRFFLAVMTACQNNDDATYIFDEVDAGVGGTTLNKLAEKLAMLSRQKQMLLVTHWPQLAARADKHFFIQKIVENHNTYTLCAELDENQRTNELLRMSGGVIY